MSIYDSKPVDPTQPIPESEQSASIDSFAVSDEFGRMQHFKELAVGAGSTTFKISKDGAWMGATKYENAPIQFDYRNGKINLFGTSVVMDGSTGIITVGNSNVKIDGVNKRIIINDGTNDRVLIGFLSGGF
jgi:hypothetical protein